MLDNKGFDLWADGYDKSVGVSDEENTYPFACLIIKDSTCGQTDMINL